MVIWARIVTIRETTSESVSLLHSIVFIEFGFRICGLCVNEKPEPAWVKFSGLLKISVRLDKLIKLSIRCFMSIMARSKLSTIDACF